MKYKFLVLLILASLVRVPVTGQDLPQTKIKLKVKKGLQVVMKDTSYIVRHDTLLWITEEEAKNIKVRENPYTQSSRFYERLEKRTSTNGASRNIFKLLVRKKGRKEKLVDAIVKSEDVFKPYAGYIIESITFSAVDLLEGSVLDTLQKASTKVGIFINKVHKDTRAKIIAHNLLFKVGDVVDPYKLADNERILRQFKTLRDARIYVSINKLNPKAVDIVVVTQDVASIGVSGSLGSWQKFRLDVYDINILGYARQLQLSYFKNSSDYPRHGYEITFREPNFRSSFIQGEIQYTDNYLRQRTRLSLGKDFFTPEIKYAGGIDLYRTREKFYFEEYDTLELPYTENNIDAWIGRSFQLDKRTNIILSTRLNTRDFVSKPYVASDSNSFFHDRTMLLSSLTLIKRNYLRTLKIRGFGRTEDVPVGGAVSLLFGKEVNQFTDRNYYEINGTWGKYYKAFGYINLSLATGSFFKNKKGEDGLLTFTSSYFSDLKRVNRTQARQFIYFTYTEGFNRTLDRTISISGKWEDSNQLPPLGNQRMTVGTETVYFMPWYLYGFQFALFHRLDINWLSKEKAPLNKLTLFPSIQVGTRIQNENLVLPRFAIDITYFGKNTNFPSAWQFKFSTTLPNLFGTSEVFKPQVYGFK